MRFANRRNAGEKLAEHLKDYEKEDVVVLGLPRGGVPVAAPVAQVLNAPLSVFVSKKIPAPHNDEFAIGAATHTGVVTWNQDVLTRFPVSDAYREDAAETALQEAQDKFNRLDAPRISLTGRTVILVDDGIATGATMRTAIQAVKTENPENIVVAVPVAPSSAAEEIGGMVSDYICLEEPAVFQAVGQAYKDFTQVTDEECKQMLQQFQD